MYNKLFNVGYISYINISYKFIKDKLLFTLSLLLISLELCITMFSFSSSDFNLSNSGTISSSNCLKKLLYIFVIKTYILFL